MIYKLELRITQLEHDMTRNSYRTQAEQAALQSDADQAPTKPQTKKPHPKTSNKPTPTTPIDMEGNPEAETTRDTIQPLDTVQVKMPRRRWEQRPVLSDTME